MAAQKKSKIASERDEEVRGLWRWLASHFDARRLVFVDESGFNISMTRLRARAPKGKRAYGKVPRNRGKSTTLIAAITLEGAMGESMTVEGATDAEAFEVSTLSTSWHPLFLRGRWCGARWAWSAPATEDKGAHRSQGSRPLILAFLLAGLESHRRSFQQDQGLVRKEGARVREVLVEAIGRALAAITPEDAAGWFAHAGYWPQDQPL
jgi:hypothetical protein